MPRPSSRERSSSRRGNNSSRNTDKPIKSFVGRAGGDPEWREAGDAEVLEFSVAVTRGYGDDAEPLWVQGTAWDSKPEMQDWIEKNIERGTSVAIEGTYQSNESGGKTYHKVNLVRVGLVEWFRPPEAARSTGRSSRREEPADDTDDLPF